MSFLQAHKNKQKNNLQATLTINSLSSAVSHTYDICLFSFAVFLFSVLLLFLLPLSVTHPDYKYTAASQYNNDNNNDNIIKIIIIA